MAYTIKQLEEMKTSEMLVIYNKATGKNISKFENRARAIALTFEACKGTKAEAAPVEKAPKQKPVKTVDHSASNRRIAKVMAEEAAKTAATKPARGACKLCGADKEHVQPAGKEGTIAADRDYCASCKREYWRKSGNEYKCKRPGAGITRTVAESWKDPAIRDARAMKQRVVHIETGEEYRSIGSAFKALEIPVNLLAKFRKELKAKGKGSLEGHSFKIAKGQGA